MGKRGAVHTYALPQFTSSSHTYKKKGQGKNDIALGKAISVEHRLLVTQTVAQFTSNADKFQIHGDSISPLKVEYFVSLYILSVLLTQLLSFLPSPLSNRSCQHFAFDHQE